MEAVKVKLGRKKSKENSLEPLTDVDAGLDALTIIDLQLKNDLRQSETPKVTLSETLAPEIDYRNPCPSSSITAEVEATESTAQVDDPLPEFQKNEEEEEAHRKIHAKSTEQRNLVFARNGTLQSPKFLDLAAIESQRLQPRFKNSHKTITRWQKLRAFFRSATRSRRKAADKKLLKEIRRRHHHHHHCQIFNQEKSPTMRFNSCNVQKHIDVDTGSCFRVNHGWIENLSTIPCEDSVNGKECTAQCLWELNRAMTEYIETIFGLDGRNLRINSGFPSILYAITEASRPIRRFQFYLRNLLVYKFTIEPIRNRPAKYKITGLENLMKMVKYTQGIVQRTNPERPSNVLPEDFQTKVTQGLANICRLLEHTIEPKIGPEESKSETKSDLPETLTSINKSGTEQHIPDLSCNKKYQHAEAEKEIMNIFRKRYDNYLGNAAEQKRLDVCDDTRISDDKLAEDEALNSSDNKKVVKEHVKLPYSWEELTELIDPSNDKSTEKEESTKMINQANEVDAEEGMDSLLELIAVARRKHRLAHFGQLTKHSAITSTTSSDNTKSLTTQLARHDWRRSHFGQATSHSLPKSLEAPSTTFQNVSAEVSGWARRKIRELGVAKTRIRKLFKKQV